MRITVTGASGFIGRRLVERLLASGHQVHCLGRSLKPGLPTSVKFSVWNPERGSPPAPSLAEADAIIHLAGEPVAQRWTAEAKRRIRSSRVDGTRALVEGLRALEPKPRVLVSASAVGYYGHRGEELLGEDSAPGHGFLAETCIEWENEARQAETLGVRVAMIRTGLALGKNGGVLAKLAPPFRLGLGGPLGDGTHWMPWVHLDDLCGIYQWAMERDEVRGAVNGCAPHPVRNREFATALGRALGRPAILPVPRLAVRLLFGEMSELLFMSQRVEHRAGLSFQFADLANALKDVLA